MGAIWSSSPLTWKYQGWRSSESAFNLKRHWNTLSASHSLDLSTLQMLHIDVDAICTMGVSSSSDEMRIALAHLHPTFP
jgi:hypothetical protein